MNNAINRLARRIEDSPGITGLIAVAILLAAVVFL